MQDNQIPRDTLINELLIICAIPENILEKMSDEQLKNFHFQKIGSKQYD